MSGLLMVCVLRMVVDGLGGGDAADQEDTQDQQNGKRSRDQVACHCPLTNRTDALMVLERAGWSQGNRLPRPLSSR